jgi:hypothetical protein
MGYANIEQQGEGIHLRQYSRAFIIEDDQANRVVFVSVDAAMMSHAVKRDVISAAFIFNISFSAIMFHLKGCCRTSKKIWTSLHNEQCHYFWNSHTRSSWWIYDAFII